MQVHTFIADSANEAVERIRAELGPSAVVLSVRKLPRSGLERLLKQEKIEVLAGVSETKPAKVIDPIDDLRREMLELKQQLALSAKPSAQPIAASRPGGLGHLLCKTGLMPAYAEMVVQELAGTSVDLQPVAAQVELAGEVLRRRWKSEAWGNTASVHAFVGVPGAGKSTVLCKMLAQTSLVEGQAATVYQLDSHVSNASPLPGVYAEIMGAYFERTVPLQFERREESVFIDLPGVSLHDQKALGRLRDLLSQFGVPEIHLVLNMAYEPAHLLEQARFFSSLGITDLIASHLDEETRWGKLWNLALGTNYCVRLLSSGQNIPGDLLEAAAELILKRQFR